MKRENSGLEPELEAFLEHGKIERHVPAEVRARVLARGRAFVAAGGKRPTEPLPTAQPPAPAPPRTLFRIALCACLALVGAAVAAAAAFHDRSAHAPAAPESPAATPGAPVGRSSGESLAPPAEAEAPPRPGRVAASKDAKRTPKTESSRTDSKTDPNTDAVAAELELLQRAQAAYTGRDYSAALALTAEHARRFPRGHLAEQREALRVRSLVGSGRTEEAHRAAAAFAVKFPRSVLLPRVEDGPESSTR